MRFQIHVRSARIDRLHHRHARGRTQHPRYPPNHGDPGGNTSFSIIHSLATLCTVKFTDDPNISLRAFRATLYKNAFHPSPFIIVENAFVSPVYSHISAGTCILVFTKSNGFELTAPNAPLKLPATNRFTCRPRRTSSPVRYLYFFPADVTLTTKA